jgi:SAM-dependent methyltransferase
VNDEDRVALATTFDKAASLYHEARPRYPERLFEDLIRWARLTPGASLLEIGCGTGIATLPLAQRGFHILCLEPGPELAARASANLSKYPRVKVIPTTFEAWDRVGVFDLVYAASAWHWLEPDVRYAKAASVLNPGGSLALFAASHAFPEDADRFFFDVQAIYEEIGEDNPWETSPPPLPDEVPDDAEEMIRSELFQDVRVRKYVWEQHYTAEQYLALLNTFSGHIAMQPEKRAHLYSEIRRLIRARREGAIRRHWLAILHVARRT